MPDHDSFDGRRKRGEERVRKSRRWQDEAFAGASAMVAGMGPAEVVRNTKVKTEDNLAEILTKHVAVSVLENLLPSMKVQVFDP